MNIHKTSAIARAFGGMAWAFDTVVRVTGKYGSKALDKMQNRPRYDVDICSGQTGEVREFKSVNINKVNRIMDSMELLPNCELRIRRK